MFSNKKKKEKEKNMSLENTNLNKGMDGLIIGPIGNKELHIFILNLGRRRSNILHSHVAHLLLNRTEMD